MTPRDRVVQAVAIKLVRVPWDHAHRERFVDAAFEEIRSQARTVSTVSAVAQLAPFTPREIKRRLRQRTPHSVRMARYVESLNPNTRARLVKEAWEKANPRWTLPSP